MGSLEGQEVGPAEWILLKGRVGEADDHHLPASSHPSTPA